MVAHVFDVQYSGHMSAAAVIAIICTVYGLIHIVLTVISGEPVYLVLATVGLLLAAAAVRVAVKAR
jgi:hypothetical protein